MSRFNNLLKWIVFQVNLLASLVGWIIIAVALYMIFGDWGSLDSSFFVGVGIVIALFGLIAVSFSCIGCLSVRSQSDNFGFWSGKKMLGLYQILLLFAFVAELYMLSLALNYVKELTIAYENITSGYSYSLTYIEEKIAQKFNSFYFGAVSICQGTVSAQYQWFWDLINKNCPTDEIGQSLCQRCDDYTVTTCYADETTCDDNGGISGEGCPYTLCRVGVIKYIKTELKPFAYGVGGFTIFIAVMIILNCMLICYTKRDSVEEILYKTGIISDVPQQLPEPMNQSRSVNATEVHNRRPQQSQPQIIRPANTAAIAGIHRNIELNAGAHRYQPVSQGNSDHNSGHSSHGNHGNHGNHRPH